MNEVEKVLDALKQPETIRLKSQQLLSKAKANELAHFSINESMMIPTASYVIEIIKMNYPNLDIPYHSRWRHFEVNGINRVAMGLIKTANLTPLDTGKMLYELVIISVLLDAGAGSKWSYKEAETNKVYTRSEGLALASLDLYYSGILSSDPNHALRVDAEQLIRFAETDLVKAFQISKENPLEGSSGRSLLLNKLGEAIQNNPQYFNGSQRLGELFTYTSSLAIQGRIPIITLFQTVLEVFKSIWPERTFFHGVALGDVWVHSALKTPTPGSEYIPFHKLSQWLSYSLMEPLEDYGITVTGLDQLTGLPEYRNGGLLIDSGLLVVKNKSALSSAHAPGSELIVEWRGLTIALIDELAILIRNQLNCAPEALPLAKILQGGTWEAGRRIAKEKRPDGTPPLRIISDGTVF